MKKQLFNVDHSGGAITTWFLSARLALLQERISSPRDKIRFVFIV